MCACYSYHRAYLIMEYLPRPLFAMMPGSGAGMPLDAVLRVSHQLLSAIHSLHRHNVSSAAGHRRANHSTVPAPDVAKDDALVTASVVGSGYSKGVNPPKRTRAGGCCGAARQVCAPPPTPHPAAHFPSYSSPGPPVPQPCCILRAWADSMHGRHESSNNGAILSQPVPQMPDELTSLCLFAPFTCLPRTHSPQQPLRPPPCCWLSTGCARCRRSCST